ncbi:hypothetical protein [Gordonia humi]|uniref:Uncharacterized protein n=1 Tax=Gordonia humi TaxID=686429 RepID=A0A840F0Q9_9ACTN|nr:hypothetical protein [Gordonia humi]MBB4136073.1 hypothetical protein [Gordonia humi]
MARRIGARPSKVPEADAKAPHELTFADVPEEFRPSSFRDVWLAVVPLHVDETNEQHCSLAYGLSCDEVERERAVGHRLRADAHWRARLASETREVEFRAWLDERGLLKANGQPIRGWTSRDFQMWDQARREDDGR